MRKLVFENPGTLDINFIRLMGVSVKDSSSAIGLFGTGLKYAIATILRCGGGVELLTGDTIYTFGTVETILRDKTFKQVTFNGERLPFTTELGKQWEPWMGIRELYSNALDESGRMYTTEESIVGTQESTHIIVTGDEFLKIYDERRRFFIPPEERPLYSTSFVDAYAPLSDQVDRSVFYKGIKVGELFENPSFRYNLKENVCLTEDRTMRYAFQAGEMVERSVIACADPHFVRAVLTAEKGSYENELVYALSHHHIEPSTAFKEVCERLAVNPPANFNRRALAWLDRRLSTNRQYVELVPTAIQRKQIDRSLDCLRRMGYGNSVDAYVVKVTSSLGENIMGRAKDGVMWISRECFEEGTKYVCSTILEEFVHLQYGYHDMTRDLQTWLFDKIISLSEEYVLQEPV